MNWLDVRLVVLVYLVVLVIPVFGKFKLCDSAVSTLLQILLLFILPASEATKEG